MSINIGIMSRDNGIFLRLTDSDGITWVRKFRPDADDWGRMDWLGETYASAPESSRDLATLGKITLALMCGWHPANVGMVRETRP